MKKIAVIGSRSFYDYDLMRQVLNAYKPFVLVSGGSHGADSLAEMFADEEGLQKFIFKPDWQKYNRGAAHRRNIEIINSADMVIAFWNGKSRGTKHSLTVAEKKGIPVVIINFTEAENNE